MDVEVTSVEQDKSIIQGLRAIEPGVYWGA